MTEINHDRVQDNPERCRDEQQRRNRIQWATIRELTSGLFTPQHDHREHGKTIENPSCENNGREQLLECSYDRESRGPYPMRNERGHRGVVLRMNPPERAEEETIF